MNNPNDAVQLKHLDSLAADVAIRVPTPTAADHDKFLRGDGSWGRPTVIIGTASSTVEGAIWLEDDA